MGNTISTVSRRKEDRGCAEVIPRKATRTFALTKVTVLSRSLFKDPEDCEKEIDALTPWTAVTKNDHLDASAFSQSPDGKWVSVEQAAKVTGMVTATHRPGHAAEVQNDKCAENRNDLRTSSGLSQKHAEEIGTSEEDGTVETAYGNNFHTTANNTAGSMENVKSTAGLGSRRPTSPEELWGSAAWEGWCKSIDQLAAETEQERMLRIIDEPYKESIGLSLTEACELDYLDNFLTPEAVLHIHRALSQFLVYRNRRGIERRRNIGNPSKYKPSPLSASFLPGSFDSEGNNIEENIKEEGEELDSDKPIAMIFSRRGARLELPKFDQLL